MSNQPKIESLKPKGSGFKLIITGLDSPLVISLETVDRLRLVEGVVITTSQLQILQQEADLYQCRQKAARLLAIRTHSVAQLKQKLSRADFDPDNISSVVREYLQKGVLDDCALALRLAQSLIERRPCGRAYLVSYLLKRLIDSKLAKTTAEVVLLSKDETDLAAASLSSRWSRLQEFDLETARTKAYNYLARRGFGYAAAKEAFARMTECRHEENEN